MGLKTLSQVTLLGTLQKFTILMESKLFNVPFTKGIKIIFLRNVEKKKIFGLPYLANGIFFYKELE